VSEAGVVVGENTTRYSREAFRWNRGVYQSLGFLGGTPSQGGQSSTAVDVSDTGFIVGTSTTNTGEQHAYRWSNGTMTDLGTLGGPLSSAVAVTVQGRVVGNSLTREGASHGFLWSAGTISDLGTLGGSSTVVADVNNARQIVGTSETSDGHSRAFLWDGGRMTDLGTLGSDLHSEAVAVNRLGQVLVRSLGSSGGGFLWIAGRRIPITSPLGPLELLGLNDHGVVCGTVPSGQGSHAFRWYRGRLTDLGTLGGPVSTGNAATPNNVVLGSATTTDSPFPHAAFWPNTGA
jgi:probable HAF family extracellular repeat protein